MNDDVRIELAALRDSMNAGFAALHATMTAGFARVDRFFELQQAQHLELRGEVQELRADVQELRAEVRELRAMLIALTDRVDRIEIRLTAVEDEVRALRDWCAREFAEVRSELRRIRREATGRDDTLRRDVDALATRVDRLEKRREEH
jgi:chromosome segregation ATPase